LELVQQLVASLPIAAQLWDNSGVAVFTNRHFNRLFSRPDDADWQATGDELLKLPGWVGGPPATSIRCALAGQAASQEGVLYRDEVNDRIVGAAPEPTKVLDLQFIPIVEPSGAIACVVCLAREHASPTSLLEQEMMRAQRMENLETLAASVAHEFNNLFTGIRGLADLIRDESEPGSDIYEFASSIQGTVLRGADLVARLGSFAHELPHQLRSRNLNEYLDNALPILQLQATKRVQLQFRRGPDRQVLLDSGRMDQALANLISNAKDALGGAGNILLSTGSIAGQGSTGAGGSTHGWAYIQIEDSGPGIPPELREAVTQPFFTTKERGKATGLGLAMTSRIVSLHKGRLEIGDSVSLGGASIRILLPLRELEPPQP
jgi:signal transduction histidine kinase